MAERPRMLNYAPPSRKSMATAWWFLLIGFGVIVLIAVIIGSVI